MPRKRHVDVRLQEAQDKVDAIKTEKAITELKNSARARRRRVRRTSSRRI